MFTKNSCYGAVGVASEIADLLYRLDAGLITPYWYEIQTGILLNLFDSFEIKLLPYPYGRRSVFSCSEPQAQESSPSSVFDEEKTEGKNTPAGTPAQSAFLDSPPMSVITRRIINAFEEDSRQKKYHGIDSDNIIGLIRHVPPTIKIVNPFEDDNDQGKDELPKPERKPEDIIGIIRSVPQRFVNPFEDNIGDESAKSEAETKMAGDAAEEAVEPSDAAKPEIIKATGDEAPKIIKALEDKKEIVETSSDNKEPKVIKAIGIEEPEIIKTPSGNEEPEEIAVEYASERMVNPFETEQGTEFEIKQDTQKEAVASRIVPGEVPGKDGAQYAYAGASLPLNEVKPKAAVSKAESAEAARVNEGGKTSKKLLALLVIGACLIAGTSLFVLKKASETTTNANVVLPSSVEIIDANKYCRISSLQLVEMLGNPDSVSEGTAAQGNVSSQIYEYKDGYLKFVLINDEVVRMSVNSPRYLTGEGEGIRYKEIKDILPMFGVSSISPEMKSADTGYALRYTLVNDKIADFWVLDIDRERKTFGSVEITYDLSRFTD